MHEKQIWAAQRPNFAQRVNSFWESDQLSGHLKLNKKLLHSFCLRTELQPVKDA